MIRRPPRSTRTTTLFPYPTLFRSAVPMNPVQHRVHPGFGRCVERPLGTPCRDGNLTERLGLLRVPRQRLAAGTGKGITCFIDGPHPAGQAQFRLSRARPASREEDETDLGAAAVDGAMAGGINALGASETTDG